METGSTSQFAPRVAPSLLFFVVACLLALTGTATSKLYGQSGLSSRDRAAIKKIAPWVTEHTANGQQAEFFVVLADQADVSHAASLQTKAEKGRYVYNALLKKSQTTQGAILRWLRERGLEHRSFYIVNAILVKGTRADAETLAARRDVARIEGNPKIHNDLPQPSPAAEAPLYLWRPATIEPGVQYTHAPGVWALGFSGQNIVVASADTGVRWTHNALKPHYRGWDGQNVDHDYNWHDSIHDSVGNPCGNDSPFPCDDNAHGSHTTGTMIGDDGMGNQIGMAPGAKWIGCRNMDAGNGTPARYIECMQWFLAPTRIGGGDPDPTKAPDITNNSWLCPPSEGCSPDTLQAAVEAQAAAGIMMIVAAQNYGPDCSTVEDPPGIYEGTYTAGALTTGTDTIAAFSSRGPVTIDNSNRIKPDITAPGTGTRSCSNIGDDAYTFLSGTSMATPHISGAMALLWSAIPSLKHQIDASRAALNNAAVHIASTQCGDAGPPNNVYGWGRVDILAAVGGGSPTPTPTPSVSPTATPTPTASPTATPCGTSKIYNIAGQIIGGYTDTTRIYDIPTNTWTTGAPLPTPLDGMATAYFDGKIYLAGGFLGSPVNSLYIYDIATDTWTTGANMPQEMGLSGFGIIDGKLYIAGGTPDGVFSADTLQVYDIATNIWTIDDAAPMPTAVAAPGSAVYNGKLYVFGGSTSFPTTTAITQIFDPSTNSWTSGPDMTVPRLWFYGAAIGNSSIIAPGGDNPPGNQLNVNEQFTANWAMRAPLPYAADSPFVVSDGTYVYIGGGYDGTIVHADLLRYDPATDTYTQLASSPDGHVRSPAVIVTIPCASPTPTATPRATPTPRARPTPAPRP